MGILATASVDLVEVDHELPEGDADDVGVEGSRAGDSDDLDLTYRGTSGLLSPDELAKDPELVASVTVRLAKLERTGSTNPPLPFLVPRRGRRLLIRPDAAT